METMGNLRRTHYVGALRAKDAGTEMTVAGSIAKCRDKGGIIFVDLRDRSGILQIIFEEGDVGEEGFAKAGRLRSEFVAAVVTGQCNQEKYLLQMMRKGIWSSFPN